MPKRSRNQTDDLEYYMGKIKKIERRMKRRHKRRRRHEESSSDEKDTVVSYFPDSGKSDNDDSTKGEMETELSPPRNLNQAMEETCDTSNLNMPAVDNTQALPATSPDVFLALGDLMPEKPKFGLAMNNDVARIWTTILKVGLQKDNKQKLMDQLVPENCPLLRAPKLNQEITSSVADNIINRDKKIETEQNQLGVGLAILSSAISTLILDEQVDRLKIISTLSDAGRVMADLHQVQTRSRKNLVLPALDKTFIDTIKDIERDEYLYGTNLIEKIKVLKTCQRSGQSIKKTGTTTNFNNGNSNNRQGNLNGPARYNQQRTVPRYGQKKMQSSYSTQARKHPHQHYQSLTRKPKMPQAKPPAWT